MQLSAWAEKVAFGKNCRKILSSMINSRRNAWAKLCPVKPLGRSGLVQSWEIVGTKGV